MKSKFNILKKFNNKKGFTLIEAICSIAILAIASLTFALFIGTSTKMINASFKYDIERDKLIQALETNAYDKNEITLINDETDEEFKLKFDKEDDIKVKGNYITVKSKKSGKSFSIFIGKRDE